jgi:hypothetical protein
MRDNEKGKKKKLNCGMGTHSSNRGLLFGLGPEKIV